MWEQEANIPSKRPDRSQSRAQFYSNGDSASLLANRRSHREMLSLACRFKTDGIIAVGHHQWNLQNQNYRVKP
jgi:hypothetical protein